MYNSDNVKKMIDEYQAIMKKINNKRAVLHTEELQAWERLQYELDKDRPDYKCPAYPFLDV